MTPAPTICECDSPSTVPDKCEVEILIDLMELAVLGSHKLLAQWTRAAFHDAGTFDQNVPEGGANGCLMNHPPMRQVLDSIIDFVLDYTYYIEIL